MQSRPITTLGSKTIGASVRKDSSQRSAKAPDRKERIEQEFWEQSWAAEQPLFKIYAQIERLISRRNIIGNVATQCLITGEKGFVRGYFSESSYALIREDGKRLEKPRIAKKTVAHIERTLRDFWQKAGKIRAIALRKGILQSQKTFSSLEKFDEILVTLFAYFLTTQESTTVLLEQKLKDILREKLKNDGDDVFFLLTEPTDSDLLLREKISRLSLLSHPTDAKIHAYMLAYPLLLTNIDSEKEALTHTKRMLGSYRPEELIQEIAESKVAIANRKKMQKKYFRLCSSPEVEHLSRLLQRLALLRLELKAAWCGLHYYLYPLYEKISRETRREIREIMMFWHMKEIVGFVQNGKAPPKTEVDQRKDFYVIMLTQGKLVLASGNRAQKLKETTLRLRNLEGLREFRGAVAYRGKVRGKALIMRTDDAREIMRIKERALKDIILVAGMTNPTMIPLAREAKAIVTDEGGVTCHAAIISREFKIPCVVGTRVATRVLKNGDMVEVDANEGVVRIVKRNV